MVEARKTLNAGDKYLKVVVSLGNVDFELPAFPNEDAAKNPNAPKYKGRNVAVWVCEKKGKIKEENVI